MSTKRLAGILITAGFALVIAASLVFPSKYYTAADEAARQEILNRHQVGWMASNWLWIVASVLAAAGVILLPLGEKDGWSMVGAGLFLVATVFWVIYLYRRSLNASVTYGGGWMELAFAWLSTGGLLLLGISFLRGGFPNWVGYVNIGYAVLLMLALALFHEQVYASFPPQVVYLIALFGGIAAAIRG